MASPRSTAASWARPSSPRRRTPTTAPASVSTRGSSRSATSGVPRARQGPDHLAVQGFRRLRDAGASSGGIAVAETLNLIEAYEERTGSLSSLDKPTTCTGSPRPPRRPSPTGTASSATSQRAGRRADQRRVRGGAGLPASTRLAQTRPIPFGDPDGSYPRARRRGPAGRTPRGPVDDPPRHGRQVGQRRVLHADHRVDRRVRDHRSRLGVPAQQRADRLQLHAADSGRTDPNLPGSGKRPRSSMSPTILVKDGQPYLAVGSPGGATIITSVSQTILGFLDRGLPLVNADRRSAALVAERHRGGGAADLQRPRRQLLTEPGPRALGTPEIGAVTAIHPLGGGAFEAAAETVAAAAARRWWSDRRPST